MSAAQAGEALDQRFIKVLTHPLRVRLCILLYDRVASPNELANEIGGDLSQVAYHIKVLKEFDCIELVKTEPRRGALEHFYRAKIRPLLTNTDWKQVPASIRAGVSGAVVEIIFDDVATALNTGTFDERDERHLSRTPMVVDEQGWQDSAALLAETLEGLLRIQTESAERLAHSGEEGILSKANIMHFKSPSPTS